MVYGALTEKSLVKFLNKQEKVFRKFQISLMKNIPEIESKKTPRAKPTCMKCYGIGHKLKQCTNDSATEAEIEKRKKEWEERIKKAKTNYNKRFKSRRTFNRNKKKKDSENAAKK